MKYLSKLAFVCLLAVLCASAALAQFTSTVNLGMKKPNHAIVNWDPYVNGDFDLLDAYLAGINSLTANSATPSVTAAQNWKTQNSGATTITNFTGGVGGQVIHVICGDTNTSIASGANITVNSNFSCLTGTAISFILNGSVWVETGRGTSITGASPFTSGAANPASAGVLRMANTDTACWRNFANGGNNCLSVNSSDALLYNGNPFTGSPTGAVSSFQTNANGASFGASTTFFDKGALGTCFQFSPWYDAKCYGAIPYVFSTAQESTTATCTGGTANCTLAAAKNFQNGEGVVIYTGGAATAQSTPSAPTVTSPTVTGSRILHYECAGIDSTGGLTAASASGSVATAPVVFGNPAVAISSISLTSNVVTVNFSSPINATGGNVQHISIRGVTGAGASWNGYWLIATAPTSSQITYALTASNGTGTVSGSSLGQLTNTAGITTISRSGTTISITTDAAHNFLAQTGGAANTIAIINGITPADLNGEYVLLTASGSSLTLQTALSVATTETGSVTAGFSTVTVYEYTTVSCPTVSAPTVNYAIYGDSATGSLAYLGETLYGQNKFVDWGPFYAGTPQQRGYVPSTPPGAAQKQLFRGNILSGAGTTSIVLTGNITSSVTSVTIVHDESLGIQTALNAVSTNGGGAVYLSPAATQFSQYAINYPVSIPQFVDLIIGSEIIGNEPVTMQGFNHVHQSPYSGSAANQCGAQFPSAPHYQCWQGVAKEYLHQGSAASADFVDEIAFNSFVNGQNFLVFDGSNGGYGEVKNLSFTANSQMTSGTDVGLTYLNNTSQLNDFHLSGIASTLSGPLGAGGQSGTQTGIMAFSPPLLPSVLFRCGDSGAGTIAENVGMDAAANRNEISYRGILIDVSQCSNATGQNYHFDDDHDQAATTPFVSTYGNGSSLNTFNLEIGRVLVDSACIAVLGSFSRLGGPTVLNENTSCGGVGLITGNASPALVVTGLQSGSIVGQTSNFISYPSQASSALIVQTPNYKLDASGNQTINTLNQDAAARFAGTSACVSSTKTFTFATAYLNTPSIIVSDETTAGGARVTLPSTAGFTVTCAGASDTFDYIVVGNPN